MHWVQEEHIGISSYNFCNVFKFILEYFYKVYNILVQRYMFNIYKYIIYMHWMSMYKHFY